MNLRRSCEHGRWEEHWEEIGAICSGGAEPTTAELLAMLVEEGVLRVNYDYESHQVLARYVSDQWVWEPTL